MANIKSAAKRARQTVKRTARNTSVLSSLKSEQKKIRKAISSGDLETAKASYSNFASGLDKAAKRGVIHKNAANRRKSALSRALKPAAAA